MTSSSPITTHVLDTRTGLPARKLSVTLETKDATGAWQQVAQRVTNDDGRIPDLLPTGGLDLGTYRLVFATGAYFASQGVRGFYPEVAVAFEVADGSQHYHVPLLLSPFGYSTYRGS